MVSGIVIGTNGDVLTRCSAPSIDKLPFAPTLGCDGLQKQRTKLEVSTYTEQRLTTTNQRALRFKIDVTELDLFDDVVIVTFVSNLKAIVELKLVKCIPINVHTELITDTSADVHLDILIENRR